MIHPSVLHNFTFTTLSDWEENTGFSTSPNILYSPKYTNKATKLNFMLSGLQWNFYKCVNIINIYNLK